MKRDTRLCQGDVPMHGSLHAELRMRGYAGVTIEHHDSARIRRKAIVRGGRTVAVLTAHECWSWLRRWNRKMAVVNPVLLERMTGFPLLADTAQ